MIAIELEVMIALDRLEAGERYPAQIAEAIGRPIPIVLRILRRLRRRGWLDICVWGRHRIMVEGRKEIGK